MEGPPSPVQLTESALSRVKDYLAKSKGAEGKYFRVSVEGGGCSGFQYGFSLDDKRADDMVVSCGEVEVLIDPQSRGYLNGSIVDYVDDVRGSGFTVKNPQAKGSCGCGVSFSV